jgi:hypothetical protein
VRPLRPAPPTPPKPVEAPPDPALWALPHVRAALARCGVAESTPGRIAREGGAIVWRAGAPRP